VEKEEEAQQIYLLKREEKVEQEDQEEVEHKISKILEIEEEVDLINKKDKLVFKKIRLIRSKMQNIFQMIKINNFQILFKFNHPHYHSRKSQGKMGKTV
jgi:hypothetical protein